MHATRKTMNRLAGAALAMAAVSLSGAALAANTGQHGENQVQCWGVNSCKGHNDCKTASNACKGQGSCKGQGFMSLTREECNAQGGKVR
ncbi:hypothetical protein [Aeromonas sp. BIGb0445]|uniref:BufA2 family periplasmic bufferin-type metallophore n=1 Tax=Aeromonas sp. BIGb0445 TaxID=2940593 RepID=UPI00216A26F0|nr:hypothetical protein [Aeromonas sp. BIGb0445]MCS3461297.1 putative membrane protein [Aeromonas sp. BIGb0445]